jgi:hypothetical protein
MSSNIEWQDASKVKPSTNPHDSIETVEVLIESTDDIWYLGIYNYKSQQWEETTDYQPIKAKWWSYIPDTPDSKTGD